MKKIIQSILFILIYSGLFSQTATVKTDLTYSVHLSKEKTNAPIIILLHGYGSNETDLFELANGLDQRFITFSIRAPFKGSEIGYSWYDLEFLPNKQVTCNYSQLKESKAKILSFISHACSAYKADSTKVFLMGFSQGAIMAYDIALTNPKKINGAMVLSGRLLEETQKTKLDAASISKLKFFIAHGFSDNIIDIKEAEKANEFLKSKNIKDVVYKNYEMPHSISGGELNDIKKWLVKQISPAPSKTK
ncbi:MAG TPA: dienelactone hydrolase family protein [Cytophaga sp.]|jgi:phospholipase/carboxylesterase|nr:dienelactone hydrolase family protein [Cytophaga sp.]